MPENPRIDNAAFFDMLDPRHGLTVQRNRSKQFPWLNVMEDRQSAQDAIAVHYKSLGFAPPKFAWAASPRSMWGAMELLRTMQIESRQVVINGLVRVADPVEAEAKRVLLEAIIERDLTVSTGACLRGEFVNGHGRQLPAVSEIALILKNSFPARRHGFSYYAGWYDTTLYPVEHGPFTSLQMQSFCIAPFLKLCWICSPPEFINTDKDGHLHCDSGPAARWQDGFEIYAQWDEDGKETCLPSSTIKQIAAESEGK